jgi:peptidoglycan/LPS O-acetylase OafA/YrhL
MILSVLHWVPLALGCVIVAQSVYTLVTGRFPPLYSKGDRALPVRPHAWYLLFSALAVVAMTLPRALDWPPEWLIVFTVLGIALVGGAVVVRMKGKKAESSTESRDTDRTP